MTTDHRLGPSSSIIHLFLSTTPFLLLFGYFLYLAWIRPSLPSYNMTDDADLQAVIDAEGPQIRLTEMIWTIGLAFGLWSALVTYLLLFVPRRRRLMQQYLMDSSTTVVLGNVHYIEGCLPAGYAMVTYPHPDNYDYSTVTVAANDDNKPANNSNKKKKRHTSDNTVLMVRKKVRTYHPFHREQVSILLLPDRPLSGQPKADVEIDVASFTRRDSTYQVVVLSLLWMLFCLSSCAFILHQMTLYDDANDCFHQGWKAFLFTVLIITPLLALGGNTVRWMWHQHWLLSAGTLTSHINSIPLPIITDNDDALPNAPNNNDDEEQNDGVLPCCGGGMSSYRFMT